MPKDVNFLLRTYAYKIQSIVKKFPDEFMESNAKHCKRVNNKFKKSYDLPLTGG